TLFPYTTHFRSVLHAGEHLLQGRPREAGDRRKAAAARRSGLRQAGHAGRRRDSRGGQQLAGREDLAARAAHWSSRVAEWGGAVMYVEGRQAMGSGPGMTRSGAGAAGAAITVRGLGKRYGQIEAPRGGDLRRR